MSRLALAVLAAGCCSGGIAPQASGPTPYVRCAMMDAPPARTTRLGDLTLTIAERELAIAGLSEAFPIAIVRGPAPRRDPIDPALDRIEEAGARVLIVLGSIGDDEESAIAAIAALGELSRPVLVLEGGRDEPALVRAAIAALEPPARERVIDVSALRRIRLGPLVLIPVPGAPSGRYARTDAACGFGEADLDAIASDIGPASGERRVLLSWAAPASVRAAIGIEGADAGERGIATLAERIGARGGLHAWPEEHAGEVLDGYAIASRDVLLVQVSSGGFSTP